MLVKDMNTLSYKEVAEDWEKDFEHKRLMIKCCKCPATLKKHVHRKMHERSCQIVAPPQTTGSGILNRYEQDDDQDDNQDDDEFRVTILKGVAHSYILEFPSKETDLHPRIEKAFENAYTSIKSL